MEQLIYTITVENFSGSPAELQACMTLSDPQASPRQGSDNIHTLGDAVPAWKQIPITICGIILRSWHFSLP